MVSAVPLPGVAGDVPYQSTTAAAKAGSDYAQQLFENAAKQKQYQAQIQAGQQFSQGNYSGASQAQAQGGDIQGAEQTQGYGLQQHLMQLQYLHQAVPVLQAALQKGGADEAVRAFDTMTPELQQLNVDPQMLSQMRQQLATNPQGTIAAANAFVLKQPTLTKDDNGNIIVTDQFGNYMHTIPGAHPPTVVPAGSSIYLPPGDTSGASGMSAPSSAPSAGVPSSPQGPAGGDALFGNQPAPANAVQSVESGGNPNAVSPAGATGTMQTMPGTLQSPGYGVQPATNNTAFEQTRVGQQYLQAMQQHYGSPTLGLIAYNMGPGRTDEWLKNGGQFKDLPKETQAYLGQVAVQAAVQNRGQPQSSPQGSASGPQVQQLPGGGSLVGSGSQLWRDATPQEKGAGIAQVNTATGEKKYMTQAQMSAANMAPLQQIMRDNPNLHGADFLAKLSPTDAAEVQAFAQGRGTQFTPMAMRSPAMKPLLDAVYQYNPQFDNSAVGRRVQAMKAFSTGKQGDELAALNTAIQHLALLRNLTSALGNGNIPLKNQLSQIWEQQTGNPAPTNFDSAKTAVGNEVSKVTAGVSGGEGDRAKIQGPLDKANSPQQLLGVMNTYTQLMAGRLAARQKQYEFATGNHDFQSMLAPETVKAMAAVQPRGNGQPPRGQTAGGGGNVLHYDAQGNRVQ